MKDSYKNFNEGYKRILEQIRRCIISWMGRQIIGDKNSSEIIYTFNAILIKNPRDFIFLEFNKMTHISFARKKMRTANIVNKME